jgi:hypothetical protein
MLADLAVNNPEVFEKVVEKTQVKVKIYGNQGLCFLIFFLSPPISGFGLT